MVRVSSVSGYYWRQCLGSAENQLVTLITSLTPSLRSITRDLFHLQYLHLYVIDGGFITLQVLFYLANFYLPFQNPQTARLLYL